MDFSGIPLFQLMRARLNYMSERQGVLAQNIANADVPEYRAKDIKTPDFAAMAKGMGMGGAQKLPMTVTDPGHVAGGRNEAQFNIENRKDTYELNPDKGNVVIEEEMMKVAQNQADYQMALNLYQKTIGMFKIAIGKSGAGG